MKKIRGCRPLVVVVALALIAAGGSARADTALKDLAGLFLNVGGYWFTDSSATRALGTPKFFGDSAFYVRPKHYRTYTLTGGVELMGAADHWLPFQGGNGFDLTGLSGRIQTIRRRNRVSPYVSFGLFEGHVRSEILGRSFDGFVPSLTVGVDVTVARYVSLTAGYHLMSSVGGVNGSGFDLGIKLF